MAPVYRTIPQAIVTTMMSTKAATVAILRYRMYTKLKKGHPLLKMLQQVDILEGLSGTFCDEDEIAQDGRKPQPVRLVFLDYSPMKDRQQVYHFEVDLVQTAADHLPHFVQDPTLPRLCGSRHYFTGQLVTAFHLPGQRAVDDADDDEDKSRNDESSSRRQGYIACVNFEVPRILFLKDDAFRKHIEFLSSGGRSSSLS